MPRARLVADSTCDVSADFARAHEITIVPLKVILGEEQFADGRDIDPATLYRRMRASPVAPRTSQPTPAEFEGAFRAVALDGAPIVCTTISADMSGTYGSAIQAREALADLDIRIIDTRTAGVGHHAVLLEVARAAQGGAGADELEAVAAAVIATQRLVFTVGSLEYLKRGGRIGSGRALLGSMLDIKPVLEIRDGRVEALDRVRTFPRAIDRVLEELSTAVRRWSGHGVAMVAHADRLADGREIARRAGEIVGGDVDLIEVGPVIGCHGGPGALGISFHRSI